MIKMIGYYLHGISTAFKCVDNFFELMLFRQGFKDECTVKTKTLGKFRLKDNSVKVSMINLIEFSNKCFGVQML